MNRTRIFITDDHEMFRSGIVAILKQYVDFEIVGQAANMEETISQIRPNMVDIVLMDIGLPDNSGIEATKAILKKYPSIKILALTWKQDEDNIAAMLKAGAIGYLLKDASVDELILAIKSVAGGNSYFSKTISNSIFLKIINHKKSNNYNTSKELKLTLRENEILSLLSEELSNKEIGNKLLISPRTVETHKRNLIHKLKVKSSVGLVKYYLSHKQLEINT